MTRRWAHQAGDSWRKWGDPLLWGKAGPPSAWPDSVRVGFFWVICVNAGILAGLLVAR